MMSSVVGCRISALLWWWVATTSAVWILLLPDNGTHAFVNNKATTTTATATTTSPLVTALSLYPSDQQVATVDDNSNFWAGYGGKYMRSVDSSPLLDRGDNHNERAPFNRHYHHAYGNDYSLHKGRQYADEMEYRRHRRRFRRRGPFYSQAYNNHNHAVGHAVGGHVVGDALEGLRDDVQAMGTVLQDVVEGQERLDHRTARIEVQQEETLDRQVDAQLTQDDLRSSQEILHEKQNDLQFGQQVLQEQQADLSMDNDDLQLGQDVLHDKQDDLQVGQEVLNLQQQDDILQQDIVDDDFFDPRGILRYDDNDVHGGYDHHRYLYDRPEYYHHHHIDDDEPYYYEPPLPLLEEQGYSFSRPALLPPTTQSMVAVDGERVLQPVSAVQYRDALRAPPRDMTSPIDRPFV